MSSSSKSTHVSQRAVDDIPEAVRDLPVEPTPTPSGSGKWLMRFLLGGLGLGIAALATSLALVWHSQQQLMARQPDSASSTPAATSKSNAPSTAADAAQDNLLGHLPYDEAPAQELQPIVSDGSIKLRQAAAEQYAAMEAAAQADGINLVVISGFRTLEEQESLFFDVKAERGQEARKRAEVSAPPGYSEHHTGYAVDIGDGSTPATNLNADFEKTAAFKWLETNAPFYSFELSFPKGNSQGVSYEPWHWRFVGDRPSLETFYKARELSEKGMESTPQTPSSETEETSQ